MINFGILQKLKKVVYSLPPCLSFLRSQESSSSHEDGSPPSRGQVSRG